MELAPEGGRHFWEEPAVQPAVPALPWYLADEEPASEEQQALWSKRRPLQ